MARHIKATSDIFIHYLFGSEQNKDLLLSFINAVLEDADFPLIKSVEILNPFSIRQYALDKSTILDIKAKDNNGKIINIEVQAMGNSTFINRSMYYWARSYSEQLESAEQYRILNPVICINILDFSIIPELDKTHSVFLPLEKDHPQLRLSNHFEIHFIEFPKLREASAQLKQGLREWLQFLKKEGKEDESMITILDNNESLKKAHEQYDKFTGNDEYRELYEARLKWQRDHNSLMDGALTEGMEKGMAQGLTQGKAQGKAEGKAENASNVAKSMKNKGYPLDEIADITGLSNEEVEKI